MTESRQQSGEVAAQTSPHVDDELMKGARQLGAEILALLKARLPSEKLARDYFEAVSRAVVSGLVERSESVETQRARKSITTRIVPAQDARPQDRYGPSNPRTLRVGAIDERDPLLGGCEVVFENDGSGLSGRTGDLAALCPRNDPDEVRQLLRAFGLRGNELVTRGNSSGPAWRVLLEDVEIGSVSDAFRETLRDQICPLDKGLFTDEYIRGANPSLLTLLRHFPHLGKCFEEFVECSEALVPQKGCVVRAVGDREHQLRVLLSDAARQQAKAKGIPLRESAWVPVYVEQRPKAHLNDNGDLPLVIVSDPMGAPVAASYVGERQSLGHGGRIWVIVLGFHVCQTLCVDFERWQQRGVLTRFDACPDATLSGIASKDFPSSMLWRWFVDRSAFLVVGADEGSAKRLDRTIVNLLVDGSGKAADWFIQPLMERRESDLYRTVTLA